MEIKYFLKIFLAEKSCAFLNLIEIPLNLILEYKMGPL